MSDVTYFMIEGTYDLIGETHIGYGIGCNEHSDTPLLFEDISVNRDAVEKLVYLCNTTELSPVHLGDVVEDFLADFT